MQVDFLRELVVQPRSASRAREGVRAWCARPIAWSLRSQGDERIDVGGAARRDHGCGQRRRNEDERGTAERRGIDRVQAVELRREHAGKKPEHDQRPAPHERTGTMRRATTNAMASTAPAPSAMRTPISCVR